jgi:O-antigen/teichoic acid export membrane protein
LPLLLIFGGLFMAADAVFEGWVNRAINFDLENVISHVMLTALFAWLTAGYFRGAIGPTFGAAAAAAATAAANATATTTDRVPRKRRTNRKRHSWRRSRRAGRRSSDSTQQRYRS